MEPGRLARERFHAILERWRIPYRSPSHEIERLLGLSPDPSPYPNSGSVCVLPFPDELSAGSGQLAFVPRRSIGSDSRIGSFSLWYGRHEGARTAYDELATILTRELGPGKPSDTASSASLEWSHGPAHVVLSVLDTPTGSGDRADAFHARHCVLAIDPGWAPAPSPPERAAFDRATDIDVETGLTVHAPFGDWSRLLGEDDGRAHPAIRIDHASGTLFVATEADVVSLIPVERMRRCLFERFFPAKGAGFVTVRIDVADEDTWPLGALILHGPWDARDATAAWVDAFTARTGIAVDMTDDPDA